jgi:transcriptional regulator with XRE-family HTH domain
MANNRCRQRFACEIKRRMKAKGWTQADVARESHLTEATISRLIRGLNRPTLRIALMVAEALSIDVGGLK